MMKTPLNVLTGLASDIREYQLSPANALLKRIANTCDQIHQDDLAQFPTASHLSFLNQTRDIAEYDKGLLKQELANLETELDVPSEQFVSRCSGEEWDVSQIYCNGDKDWIATVETSSLAERLTDLLNDNSLAPGAPVQGFSIEAQGESFAVKNDEHGEEIGAASTEALAEKILLALAMPSRRLRASLEDSSPSFE